MCGVFGVLLGVQIRSGQGLEQHTCVVPDTCADIIITVNLTKNQIFDINDFGMF